MLLYQDVLTGDEMFSDAFPVFVPFVHYFDLLIRGIRVENSLTTSSMRSTVN